MYWTSKQRPYTCPVATVPLLLVKATVHYMYTQTVCLFQKCKQVDASRNACPQRSNSFSEGISYGMCSIQCHIYVALHTSCFSGVLMASALLVAQRGRTAFC